MTKPSESEFLVKRPSTSSGRPEPVEGRISLLREACEKSGTGEAVSRLKAEVFETSHLDLRPSAFGLRTSCLSRSCFTRKSGVSAVAVEVFVNYAG